MRDLFASPQREILPIRRIPGRVEAVHKAAGGHFVTSACQQLDLTFEGIHGDIHSGLTRKAGGREPWYRRGTHIRNERQVTLVCPGELADVAAAMGVPLILPEWLGANIVASGIPALSMLPPRTLLFFASGVVLKVDGQNAPCKVAGKAVAAGLGRDDQDETALAFVAAAKRLRGLVAWVEKPGTIKAGDAIEARLPEQWLYRG